jgi:hypothetical protein
VDKVAVEQVSVQVLQCFCDNIFQTLLHTDLINLPLMAWLAIDGIIN